MSATPCVDDLLYLDFDGVLHHEEVYLDDKTGMPFMHPSAARGRVLFEWASRLEELLEPYPNVGIVLSTSWVIHPGPEIAVARLPRSLRSRVVGATYHPQLHGSSKADKERFQGLARGNQVILDVACRQPRRWLAVDDNTLGWLPQLMQHVVLTDGRIGLGCPSTRAELKAKLARMPETGFAAS